LKFSLYQCRSAGYKTYICLEFQCIFSLIHHYLFLTSCYFKTKKYLKFLRSLIYNVWFKTCLIPSISYLSFPANIISSIYTNNVVKDPLEELINKEWSFLDWVYPIESKTNDSLANHSLLARERSNLMVIIFSTGGKVSR